MVAEGSIEEEEESGRNWETEEMMVERVREVVAGGEALGLDPGRTLPRGRAGGRVAVD